MVTPPFDVISRGLLNFVRTAFDTSFSASNAVVVTWDRARDSESTANTFQVVITTDMQLSTLVMFNFGECESQPPQRTVSYVQMTRSPEFVMLNWDGSVYTSSENDDNDYLIYDSRQTNVNQPGRFIYGYTLIDEDLEISDLTTNVKPGILPSDTSNSTNSTAERAPSTPPQSLWFLYIVAGGLLVIIASMLCILAWLLFKWKHLFQRLPDQEELVVEEDHVEIEMNDDMDEWQRTSRSETSTDVARNGGARFGERFCINENEL